MSEASDGILRNESENRDTPRRAFLIVILVFPNKITTLYKRRWLKNPEQGAREHDERDDYCFSTTIRDSNSGTKIWSKSQCPVLFFFSAVKFQSLGLPKRRVTSGVPKVFLRIARKTILFEQKT